jgi:uncharacterized membrane protein YoaK (UPF0700 family)
VIALTLTTGAVDATAFLALGKVFSSVITGNLVLLGVAAGNHDAGEAVRAAAALAGYCAGVLIGAPIAARGHPGSQTWPVAVTLTLLAELCLLAAFTAGWELSPAGHGTGLQMALLVLLSAATGLQSAAVRRLGQMSSTYLTSTLTGVVAGLATRTKPDGLSRSVGALIAIVAGAVAGALLIRTAPAWLPAVVLAPGLAVACVAVLGRDRLSRPPGHR